MKPLLAAVCVQAALLAGGPLFAQSTSAADLARLFLGRAADRPPRACADKVAEAMHAPDDASRRIAFSYLLNPNTSPLCGSYLVLSSTQFARANTASRGELLKAVEQQFGTRALGALKAVALQAGSSTGTGSSTSLTAKGLSSRLLSVAAEYGALAQSTSKATTTIQGALSGLPVVFLQKGALVECTVKVLALAPCLHQGALAWMSRISYALSYDTSPSSGTAVGTPVAATPAASSSTTAQPVLLSNDRNSISAVTAKVVLIPGRLDTAAYGNADKKISASSSAVAAIQGAQDAFAEIEQMGATPESPFQSYVEQEVAHLSGYVAGHSQGEVVREWRASADQLTASLGVPLSIDPDEAANSQVLQQAATIAFKYVQYLGEEEAAGFAAIIAAPPVLTAEYDWNRPSSAPGSSVFRVIVQKTYRPVTVTVNGALSVYNQIQPNVPGAGRLRDSQFAAELSHPFAVTLPAGAATNFTVSGAFYDQYQSSPAILNVTPGAPVDGVTFVNLPGTASQVYGTAGNIAIGQLKLTAGGGSAVTVPLSVTYSNRTELIASPTWKAQIGLSYDFDSLFKR